MYLVIAVNAKAGYWRLFERKSERLHEREQLPLHYLLINVPVRPGSASPHVRSLFRLMS